MTHPCDLDHTKLERITPTGGSTVHRDARPAVAAPVGTRRRLPTMTLLAGLVR